TAQKIVNPRRRVHLCRREKGPPETRRALAVNLPQTVTACREFWSFRRRFSSTWAALPSISAARRRPEPWGHRPGSAGDVSTSAFRVLHLRHRARSYRLSKHARWRVLVDEP